MSTSALGGHTLNSLALGANTEIAASTAVMELAFVGSGDATGGADAVNGEGVMVLSLATSGDVTVSPSSEGTMTFALTASIEVAYADHFVHGDGVMPIGFAGVMTPFVPRAIVSHYTPSRGRGLSVTREDRGMQSRAQATTFKVRSEDRSLTVPARQRRK